MKIMRLPLALLCCASFLTASSHASTADPDPYEPLKLYDGGWQVKVTLPEKKPDHLMNHCARTGTFFSCEQEVNGKTTALVIFLPIGKSDSGGLEYRTLVALPDAGKPGDWGRLVIDGNTWTYSWTEKNGEKIVAARNVNHFKDNDHIHFELQRMEDGANWKTEMAGDEERAK
jgi:hypothetical protein